MKLGSRLVIYGIFGVAFTISVLVLGIAVPALRRLCDILLRPAAMLTVHDVFTMMLGLIFQSILVAAICGILVEIIFVRYKSR